MPATPAPTATPAIYCRAGTYDATVLRSPAPSPRVRHRDITVTVLVHLSASGDPTAVTVQQSSGNFRTDIAAKTAAMRSTYAPKLMPVRRQSSGDAAPTRVAGVVCGVPVPSTYLYTVIFSPGGG